jgi:hypothetical protein
MYAIVFWLFPFFVLGVDTQISFSVTWNSQMDIERYVIRAYLQLSRMSDEGHFLLFTVY